MVVVAQLVRAPDCGSGGRRFETGLPPFIQPFGNEGLFYSLKSMISNTVEKPVPIGVLQTKYRENRSSTLYSSLQFTEGFFYGINSRITTKEMRIKSLRHAVQMLRDCFQHIISFEIDELRF